MGPLFPLAVFPWFGNLKAQENAALLAVKQNFERFCMCLHHTANFNSKPTVSHK